MTYTITIIDGQGKIVQEQRESNPGLLPDELQAELSEILDDLLDRYPGSTGLAIYRTEEGVIVDANDQSS